MESELYNILVSKPDYILVSIAVMEEDNKIIPLGVVREPLLNILPSREQEIKKGMEELKAATTIKEVERIVKCYWFEWEARDEEAIDYINNQKKRH